MVKPTIMDFRDLLYKATIMVINKEMDVASAKAVAHLVHVAVESAKVEVINNRVMGISQGSGFLPEEPMYNPNNSKTLSNPIKQLSE